jgi:HEAT repeat protein
MLSEELELALQADDSGRLQEIIEKGKQEDFGALQSLLTTSEAVNPAYRRKALWALGRWDNPEVVPRIREIMPQLPEVERIAAVDALGRIGTPEALAGVIAAADDESLDVQRFVVRALGRINTGPATEKLREIEARTSDEDMRQLISKQLRKT